MESSSPSLASSAAALGEFPAAQLTGTGTKLLAMLVLGVGSFVSGGIPLYLDGHRRFTRTFLITVLLCFGAGVLLATALVHMLADVRVGLGPRYAEVVFCGGYFLVYAIEELVLLCTGGLSSRGGGKLGAADGDGGNHCCSAGDGISLQNIHLSKQVKTTEKSLSPSLVDNAQHAPVTGTFTLLLALCVHSLLEGLAIGVQQTAPRVLLLLGAISAHKFVVAFCLGIEICSQQQHQQQNTQRSNTKANLVQILIFSLGSVVGIAIGMTLDGLDDTFQRLVMPGLQGVAGGTLLYVTVSEVLPRERTKARVATKAGGPAGVAGMTGIWQLVSVVLGFSVMATLSVMISDG